MPQGFTRGARRRWIAAALGALLIAAVPWRSADANADDVRALWVVRTTLTSPPAIAAMVTAAKASGFNTLVVQVRGRGDAYYDSAIEPRAAALAGQDGFDPLATTIARAREAGLRVHAWVNVNLVAGVAEAPAAKDHIVHRHPEWLMVPRALADDLSVLDPRAPEYLEGLIRYVRGEAATLEGLYLSPITPAAAQYTVSVVRDIARRYDVDGVHLDYIRYPSSDFDYSRASLLAFRQDVIADLSPDDRRTYDARMAVSPLIYAETFPDRWRRFRTARLTALAAQLQQAISRERPGATVSAAVVPDWDEAVTHRFQDWRDWLARDLLDVVCPMAYTTDPAMFASQIAAARDIAGTSGLWAGIGAYRLLPAQIAAAVESARREGADGVILFSYDSLIDPARGPGHLGQVGRAAFGTR